jgi:hypothetical protein
MEDAKPSSLKATLEEQFRALVAKLKENAGLQGGGDRSCWEDVVPWEWLYGDALRSDDEAG